MREQSWRVPSGSGAACRSGLSMTARHANGLANPLAVSSRSTDSVGARSTRDVSPIRPSDGRPWIGPGGVGARLSVEGGRWSTTAKAGFVGDLALGGGQQDLDTGQEYHGSKGHLADRFRIRECRVRPLDRFVTGSAQASTVDPGLRRPWTGSRVVEARRGRCSNCPDRSGRRGAAAGQRRRCRWRVVAS